MAAPPTGPESDGDAGERTAPLPGVQRRGGPGRRTLRGSVTPLHLRPSLALLVLLLPAAGAAADAAVGAVRLRYGVARHHGTQAVGAQALDYRDNVFDDVGAALTVAPRPGWSLHGAVEHERLALVDRATGEVATRASLLRVQAGVAAHLAFGPVRLEPQAGYALAQLPSVEDPAAPRVLRAVRRSVFVGGRVRLPLVAGAELELSGQVPLALFAIDGMGRPVDSTGRALGVAVGRRLGRSGPMGYALWLDGRSVSDRLRADGGRSGAQDILRLGVALELHWLAPPAPEAE